VELLLLRRCSKAKICGAILECDDEEVQPIVSPCFLKVPAMWLRIAYIIPPAHCTAQCEVGAALHNMLQDYHSP
jgi:hypothetical protein